ncbi:MAG: Rieske 2Fe-2S domain-containing protein [Candidatus Thermoplasmatota archaeon]|jgi:Rieske Fe-S protein|nr:Rieske 2Fe-2S domain-containing protein [Candidatus Thermoplasmatota archaeon]
MTGEQDPSRRGFLKVLVGLSAVVAAGGLGKGVVQNLVTPSVGLTSFPETQLYWVNPNSGNSAPVPLKSEEFQMNSPSIWIYYYPLSDEPNFIIKLGKIETNGKEIPVKVDPVTVTIDATGTTFLSPGGVGKDSNIVSFSAICQHLGCIPPVIHYYPPSEIDSLPANVKAAIAAQNTNGELDYGVIHCNCHGSTYNPFMGAGIVTHPTYRPLPNVILKWDPITDYLYAKKLIGPVVFGHPSDLTGGNAISNLKKSTVIKMSSS